MISSFPFPADATLSIQLNPSVATLGLITHSRIITKNFEHRSTLIEPEKETSELTPIVRSLKGSLKGVKVGKKDYHKYLEEKHL